MTFTTFTVWLGLSDSKMKDNDTEVNNQLVCMMLLAGDIGGTSTRLGVFDGASRRPRAIAVRIFTTLEFADLPSMIESFVSECSIDGSSIDRAAFGVAGP